MARTLTFEQWQSTRKKVKVKGTIFEDWDMCGDCTEVWAYQYDGKSCNGYIEIHSYYRLKIDTLQMERFEANYLMLERDEYISWDITELEHKLYDWYADEGVFDDTETQMQRSIECDVHNFLLTGWNYMHGKYNPEYKKHNGTMTTELSNELSKVLTNWVRANVNIKKRWPE